MSLATYADANAFLDQLKIGYNNAQEASTDALNADNRIKGALYQAFGATVTGWDSTGTPEATPALVREAAAMYMAGMLYERKYSEVSVGNANYGIRLERRADTIIQAILSGDLQLFDKTYVASTLMSEADFWPNDTTVVTSDDPQVGLDEGDPDRRFTMDRTF